MSLLVENRRGTLTPSAGTASVTIKANNRICLKIFVKPATDSTTFDVTLIDKFDDAIYEAKNNTGLLNDSVVEPVYSNWTFRITNALVDEAFTYSLAFRDN